ncbi:MAG: hypothetical protein AB1352_02620 [Patescibacteria group bacterium]
MIPNLFKKEPIPEKLPVDMMKVVEELKRCQNQDECLQRAYDILTTKYRGYKFRTYTRFWEMFETDLDKLWARSGFLHCHLMDYLMRVLLVKSGWFRDEDLVLKITFIWYISIHQHLLVHMRDGRQIHVDIWYAHYGKKLGDYARGFR